jgi:glycosidase
MFEPWECKENKILNPHVLELHKRYVDMCVDLGFDGIRTDVSRAKPIEFWNVIIPYSHSKDPEFGWLAETYTYEDASPQLNMPHDRPYDQLIGGHDSYYGQYHIYEQWTKASDLHEYVAENIRMSNDMVDRGLGPKSLIGSFMTHDDVSAMFQGGAAWCMLTSGIQATLPQVNTYYVDGFQSGDYYLYPYDGAKVHDKSGTMTDNKWCTVHTGMIDIFNYSRKPGGDYPEIGEFITETLKLKNGDFKDVINKGSYIPLETSDEKILAYARHEGGKTLLIVANRDVNHRTAGTINIPGLKVDQPLNNLVPAYSGESYLQKDKNKLTVDLASSRFHVFEIDTPNIEQEAREVHKQKR